MTAVYSLLSSLVKRTADVYIVTCLWLGVIGVSIGLEERNINHVPNVIHDVCPLDEFTPYCDAGDVILMKHAHVGRKLDRCSAGNTATGCYGDALRLFDEECSGRQSCSVSIMNPVYHKLSGCSTQMTVYLEASYECVTVTSNALEAGCNALTGIINITQPSGYLVPSSRESDCYWKVTAQEGQRIKLWLYDFALTRGAASDDHFSRNCPMYATVYDGIREVSICPVSERSKLAFSSSGHAVEIHINAERDGGEAPKFMFRYEAYGCPTMVAPEGGYVSYVGENSVTVSCNHTTQVWHLVCRGRQWGGTNILCDTKTKPAQRGSPDDFPKYGLVVAVIIGVIIGIVCGFSMLATVLWCRRRKWRSRRQRDMEMVVPSTSTTPQSRHAHCTHTVQRIKGEYGLTHVWEVKGQGPGRNQGHGQGQGPSCQGHTHPGGRSQSAAGSNSPDSAYLTYQAGSSTTASSGPGSTIGVTMASIQRPRDPIYEPPHMLPDGTLVRHQSPLPCCRQFLEPAKVPVAVETPVVPHTSPSPTRPSTIQPVITTPVSPIEPTIDSSGSGLSDDTDDDDKSLKFIQKCGYALVPSSPDDAKTTSAPPRERKENHYT